MRAIVGVLIGTALSLAQAQAGGPVSQDGLIRAIAHIIEKRLPVPLEDSPTLITSENARADNLLSQEVLTLKNRYGREVDLAFQDLKQKKSFLGDLVAVFETDEPIFLKSQKSRFYQELADVLAHTDWWRSGWPVPRARIAQSIAKGLFHYAPDGVVRDLYRRYLNDRLDRVIGPTEIKWRENKFPYSLRSIVYELAGEDDLFSVADPATIDLLVKKLSATPAISSRFRFTDLMAMFLDSAAQPLLNPLQSTRNVVRLWKQLQQSNFALPQKELLKDNYRNIQSGAGDFLIKNWGRDLINERAWNLVAQVPELFLIYFAEPVFQGAAPGAFPFPETPDHTLSLASSLRERLEREFSEFEQLGPTSTAPWIFTGSVHDTVLKMLSPPHRSVALNAFAYFSAEAQRRLAANFLSFARSTRLSIAERLQILSFLMDLQPFFAPFLRSGIVFVSAEVMGMVMQWDISATETSYQQLHQLALQFAEDGQLDTSLALFRLLQKPSFKQIAQDTKFRPDVAWVRTGCLDSLQSK